MNKPTNRIFQSTDRAVHPGNKYETTGLPAPLQGSDTSLKRTSQATGRTGEGAFTTSDTVTWNQGESTLTESYFSLSRSSFTEEMKHLL